MSLILNHSPINISQVYVAAFEFYELFVKLLVSFL